MKTILNSFCIRTNIFQVGAVAIRRSIAHGLTNLKTALATKLDPKKGGEPEHHEPPFGRSNGRFPVKITWSDEKDFEVTIKVVRDSVRPRKSSKTELAGWIGACPAVLCPNW